MGDESFTRSADMMLSSREGVPFPFAIIIRNALTADGSSFAFEIKGNDPGTGVARIFRHQLNNNDHENYQYLFEKLAIDFGLRLPRNREPAATQASSVRYREVLTKNLAPGMIYGYGDPAVTRVEVPGSEEAWYYLVSTSNDAPDSFPIIRSKNLTDWEFSGYVFPRHQKPAWAADGPITSDYWAPEMHRIGNEFRIYFVARDKHTAELCIGVARSLQPDGPFIPDLLPVLKGNRIDPHVFVTGNGLAYLYWKEDNNDVWPGLLIDLLYEHPTLINRLFPENKDRITASFIVTLWPWARMKEAMERFQATQIFIEAVITAYAQFRDRLQGLSDNQTHQVQEQIRSILHYMETPVFAQQLSADGSALFGAQSKVIKNDLAWEAHLVEGMWVTKQAGKYYLFYTGNDFSTTQYGIGVAIADSHLGPYEKMEIPLLQSTENWWAPGHPSLVVAPDGKAQLFLHAYFPGKAGFKQFRALLSVEVMFTQHQVLLR